MSATQFPPLAQAYAAGAGNVRVWLAQDGPVKSGIGKGGKPYRSKEVVFADESGQCKGMCWDQWVDVVQPGLIVQIINPNWKDWQGTRSLHVGKLGQAIVEGQQPGTLGAPGTPPPAPAPAAQRNQTCLLYTSPSPRD